MDRRYIHAGSRAKVLEYGLLNENQIELLVSAKSEEEVYRVLQDTFLAPYLNAQPAVDATSALDRAIVDARKTLTRIAPEAPVLDILWLRYDFHNLKTITKSRRAGHDNETILIDCFEGGLFSPSVLLRAFDDGRLRSLNPHFATAVEEAAGAVHVFKIDIAMNVNYFKAIRGIADTTTDRFIKDYVTLMIDLSNLKAALRSFDIDDVSPRDVFVAGGSISQAPDSKRQVLERFHTFGGPNLWQEAIEIYESSGDYGPVEKRSDEYLATFIKERGVTIFTSASLFSYFTALKQHAQIIGSALVAKRSGLPEHDLRVLLRRVYA